MGNRTEPDEAIMNESRVPAGGCGRLLTQAPRLTPGRRLERARGADHLHQGLEALG